MIDYLSEYAENLNSFYKDGTNDHDQHNSNPNYWKVLLKQITENSNAWDNKKALDFGCGKSRNVRNLHSLANWSQVDGIDISQTNINYCKSLNIPKSNFYKNNGKDLADLNDEMYDFVMSTIVLSHICMYDLRYGLIKEIYRVLKPSGVFSFQMGFGPQSPRTKLYHENFISTVSNGQCDVRVSSPDDIKKDLEKIGFIDFNFVVLDSWEDPIHPFWIYVSAKK